MPSPNKLAYSSVCVIAALATRVCADVIYSDLLDTPIPLDFTGVTVNIDGGTINPFFGGVGVANNAALQPFRDGTGGLDTILNFGAGSVIDASDLFLSSGNGGSQDHLGTTFSGGDEGYIGFRLNGADYGWMRVIFTNNTSGAIIKDWAYESSGGAIATGNILRSGSVVTLDSSLGSFALGSQLNGSNSVVKTGANTVTLNAANTYSGATSVNQGTLLINGNQSAATGSITVNPGSTLGGTGIIGGPVTLEASGAIAPGSGIGILATGGNTWNGGSILFYEFSTDGSSGSAGNQWDQLLIADSLDLTGASSFNPITLGLMTMEDAADSGLLGSWDPNSAALWSGFVTTTNGITGFSPELFSFDTSAFQNPLNGSFSMLLNGNSLDLAYTPVPEINSVLLSGLGLLLLLRRRRS